MLKYKVVPEPKWWQYLVFEVLKPLTIKRVYDVVQGAEISTRVCCWHEIVTLKNFLMERVVHFCNIFLSLLLDNLAFTGDIVYFMTFITCPFAAFETSEIKRFHLPFMVSDFCISLVFFNILLTMFNVILLCVYLSGAHIKELTREVILVWVLKKTNREKEN